MKIGLGVFSTDQVSRDKIRIPAAELMRAYQGAVKETLRSGLELGLPVNMQHDMHRLIGWSRPLGLYIDGSMVRSLGEIEEPTTAAEQAKLSATASAFWEYRNQEAAAPFADELLARIAVTSTDGTNFLDLESPVVHRAGIAAEQYPELFTPGQGFVDKDGLMDYRELVRSTQQVQPGVFHEPRRNLLLFAHRFFRKSLSHRNKFNDYFLQSLKDAAAKHIDLRIRLKLDPDVLGHPAGARNVIEMEYWRGHRFNDNIASIPSGVAEHKADERSRHFHGIDRTQIWWKDPESRGHKDTLNPVRTLEVEELIDNESKGLQGSVYGCRYAHAEFSANADAITHFDGAIRAYPAEAYFDRIDTSIDKAGKHSDYSKVFRFDGALPISDWKRLLTDYFQGNTLIPEYLGSIVETEERAQDASVNEGADVDASDIKLAVLVGLDCGTIEASLSLLPELTQQWGERLIPFVEVGAGATEAFLIKRIDFSQFTAIGFEDGILNLSRLCFGNNDHLSAHFRDVVVGLSNALEQDVQSGLVQRAAIPLAWCIQEMIVTLSIAGDGRAVTNTLRHLADIIDPKKEPHEWIEAVSDWVKKLVAGEKSSVLWQGIRRGVLEIERSGVVGVRIRMPDELQKQLIQSGDLTLSGGAKKLGLT